MGISRLIALAVFVLSVCTLSYGIGEYRTQQAPKLANEDRSLLPQKSSRIVASGWIEGSAPSVEVQTRLAEQVEYILVKEGEWVTQGALLIHLDSSVFRVAESLALAELAEARAKLARIENGYRKSEIETARGEMAARKAEWEGSRQTLERLRVLVQTRAASLQEYEEALARVLSLEGMHEAARNRLAGMEEPARVEDINAARAVVEAAKSRLDLAKLNLERTQIRSPIDGRVLRINVEIGEIAQPNEAKPLVILADIRRLHAVVEVDEFDALYVELGQRARLTVDSVTGVLAEGKVVRLEPQMTHKQMNMNRPGARVDSLIRRIWIALESSTDFPVGLPVDVEIETVIRN